MTYPAYCVMKWKKTQLLNLIIVSMHDICLSASSQELHRAVYIIKIEEMGNAHIK